MRRLFIALCALFLVAGGSLATAAVPDAARDATLAPPGSTAPEGDAATAPDNPAVPGADPSSTVPDVDGEGALGGDTPAPPQPQAPAPPAPEAPPAPAPLPEAVSSTAEALTEALSVGTEPPAPVEAAPVPEDETAPAGSVPDIAPPAPVSVPEIEMEPEMGTDQIAEPLAGLPEGEFAGYATGTVVHADALQSGGTRLANVDVAFSGAAYSSAALEAQINELAHLVVPAIEAQTGFGRGNALDLDLGEALPNSGSELLDLEDEARADAPPDTGLVSREVLDVEIDPILRASVLRAQALAELATSGCVLGTNLAHGLGYVTDLHLLDLTDEATPDFVESLIATEADDPERSVSQSVSHTYLTPTASGGPPFAIVSETRQTIAPITLFDGTEHEITIEVLGEWVLRAITTGTSSNIHYGPEAESPETPVLRIINADNEVQNVVTFQQLLGEEGLVIEVGNLIEIAIGEDPRAIGGEAETLPTTTATDAAAAVDVVRVRLLDSDAARQFGAHLADLRIGHMEVAAAVPEGGIECPGIGIAKQANPATVDAGETFEWIVTVSNPNDCVLSDVDVVDSISTTPGVRYTVISTEPQATSVSPTEVVWNDIGPLGVGESKQMRITVRVAEDSAAGRFTDRAVATGVCGPAGDEAEAGVDVPVVSFENEVVIHAPDVDVTEVLGEVEERAPAAAPDEEQARAAAAAAQQPEAAPGGMLPRTGGALGLLTGLAVLGTGTLLRRLRAR